MYKNKLINKIQYKKNFIEKYNLQPFINNNSHKIKIIKIV